jgi:hypothetical protein
MRAVSLTHWADRLCSHSRLIRESLAPEVVDGSDIRLITLSATAMWTCSGAQVSTGWLLLRL